MANSGGLCDLHPGITAGLSASSAASHSHTPRASHSRTPHASPSHTPHASPSRTPHPSPSRTPHAPSLRQANLHSRHLSTLSKTMGLSCHGSLLAGECPNTDASFSVSLSTEPLLPSVANVLRADGIADLLKTYPNQRFVDTLTSIALYGARIGFQGNSSGHIRRQNHSSALEVITE